MNDLFNKRRNIRSYIFMINMLKLVRSMAVSNNCSISAIEGIFLIRYLQVLS